MQPTTKTVTLDYRKGIQEGTEQKAGEDTEVGTWSDRTSI
jgi:hypothetical protein